MSNSTLNELVELETLAYSELRARCADKGLEALPARLSPDLMRHLLANAIQGARSPKSPKEAKIMRALERSLSKGAERAAPLAQSGSVLTRDWKGRRHIVRVSEDGYEWEGETYRSLSKIAQLITGTRWSGPRFFGVRS
ncbi:MAG: DUF2924 domain-containing protein [Pseudomonadota bacterium]